VPVAVACPTLAAGGCRGTILLSVLKPKVGASVSSARRRVVRRGRKLSFHLGAGTHRSVRAPVVIRALRRSVRRGRARLRMRVRVQTAAGAAVRTTTFTVHYRRTAHRRFKRRH
jgi:hypothetical protein